MRGISWLSASRRTRSSSRYVMWPSLLLPCHLGLLPQMVQPIKVNLLLGRGRDPIMPCVRKVSSSYNNGRLASLPHAGRTWQLTSDQHGNDLFSQTLVDAGTGLCYPLHRTTFTSRIPTPYSLQCCQSPKGNYIMFPFFLFIQEADMTKKMNKNREGKWSTSICTILADYSTHMVL